MKVCDFRPLSMPYLDDRGKPSDSRVYSNLHLSIITKNRLRSTLDKVLRGISHLRRSFEVLSNQGSVNFSKAGLILFKVLEYFESSIFVFSKFSWKLSQKNMVLKAPVEIEIEKSKDGLGLNIKGGLDRPFIEVRDPGDLLELTDQCQEEEWVLRSLMKEDTGIFVSNIRESGAVAEVRIFS